MFWLFGQKTEKNFTLFHEVSKKFGMLALVCIKIIKSLIFIRFEIFNA